MTSELKTCPFCGGKAVLHHGRDLDTGAIVHVARCDQTPDCGSGPFTRLVTETVSAWNRRAPDEATALLREVLHAWDNASDYADIGVDLHGSGAIERIRRFIAAQEGT